LDLGGNDIRDLFGWFGQYGMGTGIKRAKRKYQTFTGQD